MHCCKCRRIEGIASHAVLCGFFHTQNFSKMECQGECKKHDECAGQIKEVIVFGEFCPTGLKFNYCQTAREEDERRGFNVEIVDEHGINPNG